MIATLSLLQGFKTYIVATMTVVSACLAAHFGLIDWQFAATLAVPSLLAMTVRHGVSTDVQSKVETAFANYAPEITDKAVTQVTDMVSSATAKNVVQPPTK